MVTVPGDELHRTATANKPKQDTTDGTINSSVGPARGKSVQMAATGEQPCHAAAEERSRTVPVKTADVKATGSISVSVGTYNCEGFLSVAHYIADCLLPLCDV